MITDFKWQKWFVLRTAPELALKLEFLTTEKKIQGKKHQAKKFRIKTTREFKKKKKSGKLALSPRKVVDFGSRFAGEVT